MSTVIEVLNKIIERKNRITRTASFNDKLYFLYDDKYLWSIEKQLHSSNDERASYIVELYPNVGVNIDKVQFPPYIEKNLELLEENPRASQLYSRVSYSSVNYPTRAAHDTFTELYLIVSGKASGADDILQAILNN